METLRGSSSSHGFKVGLCGMLQHARARYASQLAQELNGSQKPQLLSILEVEGIAIFIGGCSSQLLRTLESLTDKQKDVTRLLGQGADDKKIAKQLNRSESTIDKHLHAIRRKTKLQSRAELGRLSLLLDCPTMQN
ncbi:MAG: helix-turn-helix transcriptional regulator [Thaumarchaeota archaeon]|nr:helix-turn-helix transcriptional regulator [Nitrososphaerota archaeon]